MTNLNGQEFGMRAFDDDIMGSGSTATEARIYRPVKPLLCEGFFSRMRAFFPSLYRFRSFLPYPTSLFFSCL